MQHETKQQIQDYLQLLQEQRKSEETITAYKNTLNKFFGEYKPELAPTNITKRDIYGYDTFLANRANQRKESGLKGQGVGRTPNTTRLSPSSMNRHYAALRQFLIHCGNAKTAKEIKSLKTPETYKTLDVKDLIRATKRNNIENFYETKFKQGKNHKHFDFYVERLRLFLIFLFTHGVRIDEAHKLKKNDIKADRKQPFIKIKSGSPLSNMHSNCLSV